ncbi:hypothetical protein N7535_007157 (mitochondrion) [Penicillium sp. DV-2018c]|nr:hypothetical protein N7535_007157 [Penicillium sp. DV-2018c]
MLLLNYIFKLQMDAPTPWGLFFQDSASPQMEGIEELHNNIMFYLAIILFTLYMLKVINDIEVTNILILQMQMMNL